MTSIAFSYWYLLFLAIPLIGLSLIPYFKTPKQYRRTRNRIVSLVLHCITIVLLTFALAGMKFVHTVSNTANEMIIVVDVSDTQQQVEEKRDAYVDDLLRESIYQNFTVGVVTFGFDQVYAVPLTTNVGAVYAKYKEAPLPDTSATDIEAALEYARKLFNHPESGKLVLVTDGKETDGSIVSSSTVSAIFAQGSRLDTVFIASDYEGSEFQVLNVAMPDKQVKVGVPCNLNVAIYARAEGPVFLNLYDNGKLAEIGEAGEETTKYEVRLTPGLQEFLVPYVFTEKGMHELMVELVPTSENGAEDTIDENNAYYTYTSLEAFKKILIIESYDQQSDKLIDVLSDVSMLGEEGLYDVSVFNLKQENVQHYVGNVFEEAKVPETVDDLRQYDQVILNNISNKDLTEREIPLDKLLYSYVYEYGGGMLTVGGFDEMTGEAHAYNRADMYGSDYQRMLPVEAINYTPPVGVFIVVDVSGSMDTELDGYSRLYWAIQGATACLKALSDRDQIGILTLESDYSNVLPLTPSTERQKIQEAINKLDDMPPGGTRFYPSLNYAVAQLRAANMEKNHIIFISDGEVSDDDMEKCANLAAQCYADEKLNLTISMVCIGGVASESTKDLVLATRPEGWESKINSDAAGCGYYLLDTGKADSISVKMLQDLKSETITEINYKTFKPLVYDQSAKQTILHGVELDGNAVNAELNGYFGVKKKSSEEVELILTGSYQVPIYARWEHGKGSVGSFMCDLTGGDWSGNFMSSKAGKQLIYNIIDDLMPLNDISPKAINYNLSSKNYKNHLTCPTTLEEGQIVRGTIITPNEETVSLNEVGGLKGCMVTRPLSAANKYSVCEFLIQESGIYTIVLEKVDANGTVLASITLYKEFSYSKEYDVEYELTTADVRANLKAIAEKTGGESLGEEDDVAIIFKDYVTTLSKIFDPRWLFLITALVLFLLDVAVRKFKFKWIHEMVREHKAKKQTTRSAGEGHNEKNR